MEAESALRHPWSAEPEPLPPEFCPWWNWRHTPGKGWDPWIRWEPNGRESGIPHRKTSTTPGSAPSSLHTCQWSDRQPPIAIGFFAITRCAGPRKVTRKAVEESNKASLMVHRTFSRNGWISHRLSGPGATNSSRVTDSSIGQEVCAK